MGIPTKPQSLKPKYTGKRPITHTKSPNKAI